MNESMLSNELLDNVTYSQVVLEGVTSAQEQLLELVKISQDTLCYSLAPMWIKNHYEEHDKNIMYKTSSYIERIIFYKNKAIDRLNVIEKLINFQYGGKRTANKIFKGQKKIKTISELKEIANHIYRVIIKNTEEAETSYTLTREVEGHFQDYYYFDEYATLSKEEQKIILAEFDVLLNCEYPLM